MKKRLKNRIIVFMKCIADVLLLDMYYFIVKIFDFRREEEFKSKFSVYDFSKSQHLVLKLMLNLDININYFNFTKDSLWVYFSNYSDEKKISSRIESVRNWVKE